jgi:hypothetical protein
MVTSLETQVGKDVLYARLKDRDGLRETLAVNLLELSSARALDDFSLLILKIAERSSVTSAIELGGTCETTLR